MKLAVFDLDGTLLRGNSSFAFCRYLIKKRALSKFAGLYAVWNYCCHFYGNRTLAILHEKIFNRLLKGLPLSLLQSHIEPFLAEILPHYCYRPAFEALKRSQHLGDFTLILSNSPSFLVKPIASYFKVDEWSSSEYALDERKELSHIAFLMQGIDKAEYVTTIASKLSTSLACVKAYSDSIHDLPLLQAVGEPIAVKPDKYLYSISQKHSWRII